MKPYTALVGWPVVVEKYLDLFARNLEMCADLGSADIRVDTVAPPNKYKNSGDHEAAKGRLAEVFQEAAQKAQEAGIKLHWEFEPGLVDLILRDVAGVRRFPLHRRVRDDLDVRMRRHLLLERDGHDHRARRARAGRSGQCGQQGNRP